MQSRFKASFLDVLAELRTARRNKSQYAIIIGPFHYFSAAWGVLQDAPPALANAQASCHGASGGNGPPGITVSISLCARLGGLGGTEKRSDPFSYRSKGCLGGTQASRSLGAGVSGSHEYYPLWGAAFGWLSMVLSRTRAREGGRVGVREGRRNG